MHWKNTKTLASCMPLYAVHYRRSGSKLAPVHGALEPLQQREKRTEEKRKYPESFPVLTVVSIRECQWYRQKRTNCQEEFDTFLNEHFPSRSEKKQLQAPPLRERGNALRSRGSGP